MEPGKRYVYRVCLALRNPNLGVPASKLAKPELAKEEYLKTKWSEPTAIIPMPQDTRVLAVSVKPGKPNVEPSSQVMLTKWVQKDGSEVFKEFTVARGQVANFSVGDEDYNSDVTIVDLRGGERIPGGRRGSDLKAIGEILLLDPNGTLIVRNELDDSAAREQATSAAAEKKAPPSMGPGTMGPGTGPGMMGPGMRPGVGPGMGPGMMGPGGGLDNLDGLKPGKKKPAVPR